ncbi:MAG: ArsC/Spx/MgsR family protein [Flavobacteriaceae bacterium]|jgi:arsenate reductase
MKQIYHLATCQTCKKALEFLNPGPEVEIIEIKSQGIAANVLDKMAKFSGSYEALFSRRAQLFKKRGLAEKSLSEQDYRSLILEHYTFLKRPVILTETNVFAGHAKATLEAAKAALSK